MIPRYVAENLDNIPPLNLSNIDILKLLKEIQNIKCDVKILTDTQMDMTKEIVVLKELKSVKDGPKSNANHSGSKQNVSISSSVPINSTLNESMVTVDDTLCSGSIANQTGSKRSVANSINSTLNESMITVDDTVCEGSDSSDSGDKQLYDDWSDEEVDWDELAYKEHFPPLPKPMGVMAGNGRWEWPNKMNKARRTKKGENEMIKQKLIIGSNRSCKIKAVTPRNKRVQPTNRTGRGIFVSRLKPRTTADEIVKLLKFETGVLLKVVKLKTRYNTYSSFYIQCDSRMSRQLLSSHMWPVGVLVKVYEE